MSKVASLFDFVPVYKYETAIYKSVEPLDYASMEYEEIEKYASELSIEELRYLARKQSCERVMFSKSEVKVYWRDPYIKQYAKRWANGICQLCDNFAPFTDQNGEPFLESHHIKPLAEGGSDSIDNVIALCPNCHRKMHILNLDQDVDKLTMKAMRVSEGEY